MRFLEHGDGPVDAPRTGDADQVHVNFLVAEIGAQPGDEPEKLRILVGTCRAIDAAVGKLRRLRHRAPHEVRMPYRFSAATWSWSWSPAGTTMRGA